MFKLGHAVDPVTYGREVLDMFNVDGSFVYDKEASFSTPAANTLSEGGKSVQEAELESSPHMMGVDYNLRNNYMPKPYGMDEQLMETYAPKPYGVDFPLEQENMPQHGYQPPMAQLGQNAATQGIGHGAADDEGTDDEKGASVLNNKLFKLARVLGTKARANLPKSDFARPSEGKTQPGSYPMPDQQHARSAVGFCEMHHPGHCGDIKAKANAKFGSAGLGSRLLKVASTVPNRLVKSAFLAGVQDEPENHRSDGLISPEEMYPQTKAKVSQAAANYRPASGPHSCATCAHFDGSGTCSKVEGHISPSMVSDLYEAGGKTAAARQALVGMVADDSKPSDHWDQMLAKLHERRPDLLGKKEACGGDCNCPCGSKAGDGKSEEGGADPKQLPERENLNRPNKNTTSEPHAPDGGPDPKQLPERADITTPGLLAARQKAVNDRYKNADSIVNNAIEAGYSPFAAAFLARTLLDGMDEPQIKQAATQAIELHSDLQPELEPLIKVAIPARLLALGSKLMGGGSKMLSKGKGLFGFGDDALRAARNRVMPARVGVPGASGRAAPPMGADPRWARSVRPTGGSVGGNAPTQSFGSTPSGLAGTSGFDMRGPFNGPVRPPVGGLPPRGTGAPPLPPGRAPFNGLVPGPGMPPGGSGGGGGGLGSLVPAGGVSGPARGLGGGSSMIGPWQRAQTLAHRYGLGAGMAGESVGMGVDALGDATGLYDTNGWGSTLGGVAGMGLGSRMGRRLMGRNLSQKLLGGGRGLFGAGQGTRGLLSRAAGPAFLGAGAYGLGQERGSEKTIQGAANALGMTPEELSMNFQKWGPAVSAFNHGDYLGAMGHGWNALDPQTQQSLLLGGGGALLGGLAGGAYGGGAGALGGGLAGGLGGAMLPHLSHSLYGGGGQGMGMGQEMSPGQGSEPPAGLGPASGGQLPGMQQPMGNEMAGGPEDGFHIRDELAAQGVGSGNMAVPHAGVA